MKDADSLFALVERLKRVAPEVLDLAVADTEAQFCAVFDKLVERAVDHLERNARNFSQLNEVGISAVLAAFFNGMPGMRAVQEGHSNGHVDLTIEVHLASPIQRRLAEAKIESGPANHVKGLAQLLERYVTGRENSSWLLLYIDKPNLTARMQALRDNLDTMRPLNQQSACLSHPIKWAFVSLHGHTSGESIRVSHIGCNLHRPVSY